MDNLNILLPQTKNISWLIIYSREKLHSWFMKLSINILYFPTLKLKGVGYCFFFFYENRAKIKKCFFFKKYDFRSIFLQKFCFLCLIFVRFSQQFPPKICFLCLIFVKISLNFFHAGHLLKNSKQGLGICMIWHIAQKEEKVLFSKNFMSFYRLPSPNFLDRSFRIWPLKNCFFRSKNRLSFFFLLQ